MKKRTARTAQISKPRKYRELCSRLNAAAYATVTSPKNAE